MDSRGRPSRRRTGEDIREWGSGSAGATNVARRLGAAAFIATLLLDGAKGAVVIIGARAIGSGDVELTLFILAVVGATFVEEIRSTAETATDGSSTRSTTRQESRIASANSPSTAPDPARCRPRRRSYPPLCRAGFPLPVERMAPADRSSASTRWPSITVCYGTRTCPMLDPAEFYRIRVLLDGTELGHADVDVANSGRDLVNVETGEYLALKDGRTLPILLRIEDAFCIETFGCVQQTIDETGGVVEFRSDDAAGNKIIGGIEIPAGALPEGVDEINVVSRFIPADEIDGRNPNITFPKFPFAFNLEFEPAVELTQGALLTVCQDEDELADADSEFFLPGSLHDDLRILQDDDGQFEVKDPAEGAAVACPTGIEIGMDQSASRPLWARLGTELRGLVDKMFSTRPLHAARAIRLHGGLSTVIISTSDFYAVLPDEGLVSLWHGDDNYTDGVGPNDGTFTGDGGSFAAGIHGQAFDFSRDGSTVDALGNGIDDLQTLSLAAWVNMDPGTADTVVQRFVTLKVEKAVIRQNLANNGAGGQLHFYMNFSGQEAFVLEHLTAPGVLQQGCFHHVAGTYDGTTMRLYLDGVELRSEQVAGTVAAGAGVMLNQADDFEGLDGRLDDIRVYDRALSAAEVSQFYDAGGIEKCAPPADDGSAVAVLLSPCDPTIAVDGSVGMLAEFVDAFGNFVTPDPVTWASSNANVATVDETGLVTGVSAGAAVITVSGAGLSASTTVTVVSGIPPAGERP